MAASGIAASEVARTRRARRQRKLDQLEIPEGEVSISEELLGTGGFGSVFLADYLGRNVAAKVWCGVFWGRSYVEIYF